MAGVLVPGEVLSDVDAKELEAADSLHSRPSLLPVVYDQLFGLVDVEREREIILS